MTASQSLHRPGTCVCVVSMISVWELIQAQCVCVYVRMYMCTDVTLDHYGQGVVYGMRRLLTTGPFVSFKHGL